MLTAGLAKVGFRLLGFLKIKMWKSPQCGFFIFSQFFSQKTKFELFFKLQQQPPFYGQYTGQPALAGTSS